MLTPYLEKLIHQGKARFRTFVCGQSGSNLLPVEDNTWIIITGFTYINFADPALIGSLRSQFQDYLSRSLHQLRFRSSKSNNHYILKDDIRRDVGAAGMSINQIINGNFDDFSQNWTLGAGWAIAGGVATHTELGGGGDLTNIGFRTIPRRRYRLTYEVTATTGIPTGVQPFLGGGAGLLRTSVGVFSEEIVAGNVPNGQFLVRGVAGAPVTSVSIDNIELILLPEPDVVIINSHYDFDCYLPHQNEVTVELVGFPVDPNVTQISAAAPASFPLATPPAGYGNDGFGGIAQVTEFRTDIGGDDHINLPLTRIHTAPILIGTEIIQNGMEITVTTQSAINQQANFGGDFGPRNFPIVNIQYVEIEGNMPANIQASN